MYAPVVQEGVNTEFLIRCIFTMAYCMYFYCVTFKIKPLFYSTFLCLSFFERVRVK